MHDQAIFECSIGQLLALKRKSYRVYSQSSKMTNVDGTHVLPFTRSTLHGERIEMDGERDENDAHSSAKDTSKRIIHDPINRVFHWAAART